MKRMSYYIIGLVIVFNELACSDDAETGREKFQWKLMADICSPT